MKNNVYNSSFLNELICKKDFEFFLNAETEIDLLSDQIKSQKNKKNAILSFVDVLNKDTKTSESNKLKENANSTIELIDANVNSLYELLETIKFINIKIHDLILLIKSNKAEGYCMKKVEDLKPIIDNFSNSYNSTRTTVFNNNGLIDSFIYSFECRDFFNKFLNKSTDLTEAFFTKDADLYNKNIEDLEIVNDNNILLVSEKDKKVYLPYKSSEIKAYINHYPTQYSSVESVIRKEFILPLDYYLKFPALCRFREAYSLIRDREAKSVAEALKYAINLMFKRDLNPVIISACKSQSDLEKYLECLENKRLNEFDNFEIRFEINPL